MLASFCLDCDREIDLTLHLTVGQRIVCPNCGVKLEVVNLDPPKLDWVYDGPVRHLDLLDDWKKDSTQHRHTG